MEISSRGSGTRRGKQGEAVAEIVHDKPNHGIQLNADLRAVLKRLAVRYEFEAWCRFLCPISIEGAK
jgi:hypothetical protein